MAANWRRSHHGSTREVGVYRRYRARGGRSVCQPNELDLLGVGGAGSGVGFLNVTAEETKGFLLSAVALILSASAVQGIPLVGELVTAIMGNLVAFMSAAVLVVALKSLFESAKD